MTLAGTRPARHVVHPATRQAVRGQPTAVGGCAAPCPGMRLTMALTLSGLARLPRTALRFAAGNVKGWPTACKGQGPYVLGRLALGRDGPGGNGKWWRSCPAE